MSVIFMEGFDLYGTGQTLANIRSDFGWTYSGTGAANLVTTSTTPRNGVGCLGYAAQGFGIIVQANLANPTNEITIGFAHRCTGFTNNRECIGVAMRELGGKIIGGFQLVNTTDYRLVRTPTTILGTVSGQTLGVWRYHEIYWNTTTGVVQLWIDGVLATSSNVTGGNIHRVLIVTQSTSTSVWAGGAIYLDDFYINEGPPLGPSAVVYAKANADAANQDWTPASGTDGFDMIDNFPIVPGDYIEGLNPGDISDFAFGGLPSSVGTLHAVEIASNVVRPDPTTESVANRLIVSGTPYQQADFVAPQSTPAWNRNLLVQNPATSGPWAASDVSALSAGIIKV